jgi:hypothetical protein
MTKLLSFFSNPWTMLFMGIACFSISVYVLTAFFVIWGSGLMLTAFIRALQLKHRADDARYYGR